jgi:hypothetical protein
MHMTASNRGRGEEHRRKRPVTDTKTPEINYLFLVLQPAFGQHQVLHAGTIAVLLLKYRVCTEQVLKPNHTITQRVHSTKIELRIGTVAICGFRNLKYKNNTRPGCMCTFARSLGILSSAYL